MRTTVDLDDALLRRAKQLAARGGATLSAVLNEALAAYLTRRRPPSQDPPFDLVVRGRPGGRFPSPSEIEALEAEEDLVGLSTGRRPGRAAT
jgi:hypothetical protein